MQEKMIKINIKEIARIEGHLDLELIEDKSGVKARARVMEGTRILERVLVGKNYWEGIEIASRMCGVCHAIHKLTATQAVENAFKVKIPSDATRLREIIAIAGHIQSHLTHLYYFALPDYYRKESFIDLLDIRKELVMKAIKLRQRTVDIINLLGGSPVHPIAPVVGGLSKEVSSGKINRLLELFKEIKVMAIDVAEGILGIKTPNFNERTLYVALTNNQSIPLLEGNVSINGKEFVEPELFSRSIRRIIEPYSKAPHYLYNEEPYFVGALSRLNINHMHLSPMAKDLSKKFGINFPAFNPFLNNHAQALEMIHYIEEAINILDELKERKNIQHKTRYKVKEGRGISVTEAPRGILIHEYELDEKGKIREANIITPTAQNLKNLERDSEEYYKMLSRKSEEEIRFELMKLVRSYDPCISCAARFRRTI